MDVAKQWNFDMIFRLNKMLTEDIAVFEIIPMVGLPNAQKDAIQRTYDYFIHTFKNPFLHGLSALYPLKNPDFIKMKQAVNLLPKYDDYSAFCKSPDKNPSNICDISSAKLFVAKNGDKIRFQITSNRFLKGMVRIIVKKLIDIGEGELTVDEFEGYLAGTTTPREAVPAYPQGLYLSKVTYPYLDLPPRTEFSTIFQNNVDDAWKEI
jgi:tRNA pseudouridine38-40 synthase